MGVVVEFGKGVSFGPNATVVEPVDDAPTINLHASFVFAKGELGDPGAFPSMEFSKRLLEAAEERAGEDLGARLAQLSRSQRSRPRPTEEWEQLRWTWSLTRAGKPDLAEKRFQKFLKLSAYDPPPEDLPDWLFQFAADVSGPHFDTLFEAVFEQLRIAKDKPDFPRFVEHYGAKMSVPNGRRYFDLCGAYFKAFPEFSQVHHLVTAGLEIGDDHAAASMNYDETRMFYGNTFEVLGEHVSILTMLNNLIEDRLFDQLRNLTLAEYLKTDKAGRCRAFAENPAFAAITAEFDNQVRNASHHGGMTFDRDTGLVEYRSGKGGQGDLNSMSYARYLARCVTLFMQALVLLRLEVAVAEFFKTQYPL
ncbi:hypothetical protein [Falsirhodobacter deserti]|uniref:hypothetical protein n=1 Tax=Falsirhodobacter deserti TaxID=1365611 RepID=UPI000FE3C7D4|nr:hypothetical protein [Falsirhodobacter deserti]